MAKVEAKPKALKANSKKVESQEGFKVLLGLDGIRTAPAMYLGELGQDMAYRCVKEPVDNAYDEHIAGRNKVIEVILNLANDLIIVADMAGGIPTDIRKLSDGTKESIMTSAFSRVHAGGKFNNSAYKTSAGTHGVGVAALNAVSEDLRVWSHYKGKCAFQRFSKGEIISDKDPKLVKAIDKDVSSLLSEKKVTKYGTVVAFVSDQTVISADAKRGKKLPKNFEKAVPDLKHLATWLKNMAHLNPSLEMRLSIIDKKGKRKDFVFINKHDIAWVAKNMCEERDLSYSGKVFTHKSDNITCSLVWSEQPDAENFLSFVNTSPTTDGGSHVIGFRDALVAAIKPYVKTKKGSKKQGFTANDLMIGLTGMFDWRMHGAAYDSQVKNKLVSKVNAEVYAELFPKLEEYFKANKKVATEILKRAEIANKGREELSTLIKGVSSANKKVKGNALPSFLSAAPHCKPHERELMVVEGDSAGGTAKDARNTHYQEVMKAKGKPLNGLKASLAKVLQHAEVQGMLISLGADLKSLDLKSENPTLSTDKLRVGNILFLADADPDGYHITVLFLAAIYRLIPDLMREGRVWVVDAPLYNALHKGNHYGGNTFEECRAAAPSAVKDKDIVRAKGWGEVPPEILEAVAFNPKTRRLIRINPFANAEQRAFFVGVVAEDAFHRRRMLGLEDS